MKLLSSNNKLLKSANNEFFGSDLEEKSVTITENGTTTSTPSEGKAGISEVEVITNVSGGGDEIESFSRNFAIKKSTVTIGANNVTNAVELVIYLLSLCETVYRSDSCIYIELHPKESYAYSEFGSALYAANSLTRRYRDGWSNAGTSSSYDAVAVEGSVYDIFYIERYTAPY